MLNKWQNYIYYKINNTIIIRNWTYHFEIIILLYTIMLKYIHLLEKILNNELKL